MLQQNTQLEKDIERSLDRLKIVMKEQTAARTIPPFYYSASLLNQYAKINGPDLVRCDFFQEFKELIQSFGQQDFTDISKNNQAIVDDILEIVDSELFIDCVRPDIYKSRGSILRHEYEQMNETDKALKLEKRESGSLGRKSPFRKSQLKSPSKTTSSLFLNQHDQIWQMVQRYYAQHNLDEAYRMASQYVQKVTQKVEVPANRLEIINKITQEYMFMSNLYEQFDKPGWEKDKEDKGITLEYKVYEEEKQIAIRIHGEFDIPPVQFLSIISEIDLMGEYVPFCYDCKEQRVMSRNQRIGTSKIYIPLLSDRETYFYAVGYDRIKTTGSLFFYSRTINEDYEFMKKNNYKVPDATEKYVRLEYKFFIVEYKPIDKKRAKIRLASKIDMKMNYLPLWILNKSARIFAFDYFKNILERVNNYKGSEWQKKVKEKPEMYDFFYSKVDQYFGK